MHLFTYFPIAMDCFPFGSLDFAPRELIPIIALTMPFLFVAVIVGMKSYNDRKNRQMLHETIRLALEKGQTLPPELIAQVGTKNIGLSPEIISQLLDQEAKKPKGNDRRTGLILIAVGAGIFLFLGGTENLFGSPGAGGLQWVGLIPGLIGVAMLVNWMLDRGERKNDKS